MNSQSENSHLQYQEPWIPEDFVPGLVSVIIPTYNRAMFLGEAIQSVVDQTYTNWECIIVDDGSTDNTRELVQGFIDKHGPDKIRYFYQENQGAQVARNKGTIESKGEFIQYLDSDDLLDKDKLSAHVDALKTSRADVVYGPVYLLIDKGDGSSPQIRGPFRHEPIPGGDYLSAELRGWHTLIATLLYRRKVIVEVGEWDIELKIAQDVDFAIRVGLAGYAPIFCSQGKFFYRQHANASITKVANISNSWLLSRERIFDKIYSELIARGIFLKYRQDFSSFIIWSSGAFFLEEPVAEKWFARGMAIGSPSKPLCGSIPFRLFWRLFGPRFAVKAIRFLAKLKRRLFFNRKAR